MNEAKQSSSLRVSTLGPPPKEKIVYDVYIKAFENHIVYNDVIVRDEAICIALRRGYPSKNTHPSKLPSTYHFTISFRFTNLGVSLLGRA